MIEVEAPDGTVVEFPDGTDPKVIKEKMKMLSQKQTQSAKPPPIPEPQMPRKLEPTVGEQLRSSVRPSMIAVGGTLGGAAGTPAGPAGIVAGGGLGAAGGEFAFQSLNDLIEFLGGERLPGGGEVAQTTGQELLRRTERAAGEAAVDVAFGTVGPFVMRPLKNIVTPLFGKVMGVRTDAARQAHALAASQGIDLGAVDIGGPAAKGFSRVLGIFPFTGAPLRQARDVKEAQLTKAVDNILNEVAPTSSISSEVGVDLLEAAQKSNADFKRISAQLYDNFRKSAKEAGPVIPSTETKKAFLEFAQEARAGEIPIEGGTRVLKGGLPEGFEEFLEDATQIPDRLTYDQWAKLQKRLAGFADQARDNFTVKQVAQIKQAMEADLDNLAVPELKQLKEQADTFFANGIVIFQTPTAAKFGRVDKNIFKAGFEKAGSLNPDELMKPVFNADSPRALKDLRNLVGEDAFRRAARNHMDNAVQSSFKTERRGGEDIEVFDLDTFANKLGLVKGMKDRTASVEVMLEGTGVKIQDLRDLVENARIAKISDPSTFVTRRATLGGVGALTALAGFGGAGAAAGAPIATVGLTLLSRHGAKLLADPQNLKRLTRAFSPDTSETMARTLILRVAREMGEVQEIEAPIGP